MAEVGGGLDFAKKPFGTERSGEFGMEDLDRHFPAMAKILRHVHGGHPALAELPLDPVTAG